jgi:hypothetical protein
MLQRQLWVKDLKKLYDSMVDVHQRLLSVKVERLEERIIHTASATDADFAEYAAIAAEALSGLILQCAEEWDGRPVQTRWGNYMEPTRSENIIGAIITREEEGPSDAELYERLRILADKRPDPAQDDYTEAHTNWRMAKLLLPLLTEHEEELRRAHLMRVARKRAMRRT